MPTQSQDQALLQATSAEPQGAITDELFSPDSAEPVEPSNTPASTVTIPVLPTAHPLDERKERYRNLESKRIGRDKGKDNLASEPEPAPTAKPEIEGKPEAEPEPVNAPPELPMPEPLVASDEIDPSLNEQFLANKARIEQQANSVKLKLFQSTGMVIETDDPLMYWFIANQNHLAQTGQEIIAENERTLLLVKDEVQAFIKEELRKGSVFIGRERKETNKAFENNLNELRALSKETSDRRDQFIAEIHYRLSEKLDAKIEERFNKRLKYFTKVMDDNFKLLANNANTQTNNERVANKAKMQGAGIGLAIGLLVAIVMVAIVVLLK